jgi:hypothetical protein
MLNVDNTSLHESRCLEYSVEQRRVQLLRMGLRTVVLINVLPTLPAATDQETLPHCFNDVGDVVGWTTPVPWLLHRYAGTISLSLGAELATFAIKICRHDSLCSRRCDIANTATNFREAVHLVSY